MFRVDVTWLGYFMALVSLYYVAVLVSRWGARHAATRLPVAVRRWS